MLLGQLEHDRAELANMPAEQSVHAVAELLSWSYLPGAHATQPVAPCAACVPAEHAVRQWVAPVVLEKLPSAHGLHSVLDDVEFLIMSSWSKSTVHVF